MRYALRLLLITIFFAVPTIGQPIFWQEATISGQRSDEIEVWSFASSSSGDLYAAALNDGVFHSSDNGDNWAWIGLRDEETLAVAVDESERVLAGSLNGRGVFRTEDNGQVWEQIGLDGMDIGALEVTSTGQIFATAGSGFPNVVYWSDDGSVWTIRTSGLDAGLIWRLHSIGSDVLLAAAANGLYRTTDAGENWTRVAFADTSVLSFAATSQGLIYAGSTTGVYRSTDMGQTWKAVWETGEHRAVLSLAVKSSGHIFAGLQLFGESDGGVYRSTDLGATWELVGLMGTEIRAMTLDAQDRVVIGTTDSAVNGIFLEGRSGTGMYGENNEPVDQLALSQNYPNPFKRVTKLSYALPEVADVKLTVSSLLGRRIKEIATGTQAAGTYEVSFDATGLPSGIYFYRLQAGDFVETKRMVIVK